MTPREWADRIYDSIPDDGGYDTDIPIYKRFATDIIAAERERCASLAEEGYFPIGYSIDEAVGVVRRTRDCIAAGIRKGT